MKIINVIALLIILFVTATTGYATDYNQSKLGPVEVCRLEGKVIKITDGDTINLLDTKKQIHKIRLAGIDAPERRQPYGKAASKFLSKQVNQQTVCIVGDKIDRYKRLVGVIQYEGRDINLELVKAGYAWHYKKYQREQTSSDQILYAAAEDKARSDVIGLWSEPDPINPSDWRKGKKGRVKAAKPAPLKPEDFVCGTKRFCGQMGSCAEACFHLQQCGLSRLDGNSDGIPCNKRCNSVC